MQTVWKYELAVATNQVVTMPRGATLLCAQVQHGIACLWARVDPTMPQEPRTLRIVGTGSREVEPTDTYVGTFQVDDGDYVFHVFEAAS